MKIHHLFCSLIFILTVTLTSFSQTASCPAPTELVGDRCVLTANQNLTQTLELPSNTTLDCEGRRLKPSPATSPQVAIFLNGVRNVLIKNCVIENFDFGVFAINSKRQGLPFQSFAMFGNTITARYTGITLMAVDNAEIIDNTVTYKQRAGKALYIGRDSDMNGASKNTFISNVASLADADMDAFSAPGPARASNPRITERKGVVVVAHLEGTDPSLQRIIVNGKLFQVVNPFIWGDEESNSSFSESNRIEGNTIRFQGVPTDGISLAIANGTHVIRNTIERGADRGIRLGAQIGDDRTFPGLCRRRQPLIEKGPVAIASGAPVSTARPCLDDLDCAPLEADTASTLECAGAYTTEVNWKTNNSLIQDNVINGEFGSGIVSSGWETAIIGNTIVGPATDSRGAGISLFGKPALESGVIRRNSVSNVAVALGLAKKLCTPKSSFTDCNPEATFFGAQISLNDFRGTTAVRAGDTNGFLSTQPPYHVQTTELSAIGTSISPFQKGNFWGTTNCQGLTGKVLGALAGSVTDSHSYNQPIADKPPEPSPCP